MSGNGLDTQSATAWVSQGFERLVDRVRGSPTGVHFDVLIVGSGYGGAIAASTFAGRQFGTTPVTVGVLERGKEYLQGAFPKGLGELPGHIRQDRNKEGLFDVRLGSDVNTLVANGVGGGSLINAGVMEEPLPSVFQNGWPTELQDASTWSVYYQRARELLGATGAGAPNTIDQHPDGLPRKYQSLQAIAPNGTFRPAKITVAMSDTTSSGNAQLHKCVRCGDCATGCNHGAKNSLDLNLLVQAQQAGAEIFSGATVLSIEPNGSDGWTVNAVHTDAALRKRDGELLKIHVRKVVLAAGTLGSSEILLRSRDLGLPVSGQLGKRCSTNGDMLIADYATAAKVNTVADELAQPSTRGIGPTITGIIDLRASSGVLIEEISVPAALRIAFTEVFATINTLHALPDRDCSSHQRGFPSDDIYVAPPSRIENSALYAVMADDGAAGVIELEGDATSADRDGLARIRWSDLKDAKVFDNQVAALSELTKTSGGRVIPNPVWKLLPADLQWLLKDQRGPLTTVHPLGGCAMGDTGAVGVVDHIGRVFTTSTSGAVHDGLVVLDGAMIPTALGTNPALTIAAVALRAAEALAVAWNYAAGPSLPTGAPLTRPVFRQTDVAAAPPATEVEIIERLVGPVTFIPSGGTKQTRIVELTLRFAPKALAALTASNGGDATVELATGVSDLPLRSGIRIFPQAEWQALEDSWDPPALKEQKLDAITEFSAPLTGRLRILERQPSSALARIWRAGKAYLLNRGLRDIYQAITDGDNGSSVWERIKSGLALASHAGEVRALVYDLTIGPADPGAKITLSGSTITGTKSFTYERRGNPWRQLLEVKLGDFPALAGGVDAVLKLDVRFLARIGVPLFRLTQQRDGVSALGELLTFLGYFARLLLGIHIWSFRAPDKASSTNPDINKLLPPATLQLPGGGAVTAEIRNISIVPEAPEGGGPLVGGEVRLTRYPNPQTTKRPVVMIHGYSASGTTFAHHAVNPNFASHLWQSGRDVWIADLRTSPGLATAGKAWSFTQIGKKDVRAAIETAAATSIDGKVDVVAHCMGTVAFSFAVLSGSVVGLVDRAAFTQVGPLVVFTPANIFRAYVVKYLLNFLPPDYSFDPPNPTLADDLWDRVLSTLPYPVEEFDVENPLWPAARTPWTRIRHRMDALYGRDFNVVNMEAGMLRYIDEHFGTLNLKTVASTIHFARNAMMTEFNGENLLVSRANFAACWNFPTFSVHGAENGLSHVSTVDRMAAILDDAGRDYRPPFINPGAGHQDALIGTTRYATFQAVEQFLDSAVPPKLRAPDKTKVAYPPWIGPIITEERSSDPSQTLALVLRVGTLPSHRCADAVIMLRVQLVGDAVLRPDDPTAPWDEPYILSHMAVYTSSALQTNRWDAFTAPLPHLMPGYDPAHPGNALLVLIVYDESNRLPAAIPENYFVAENKQVYLLDPLHPATGGRLIALSLQYDEFKKIAVAALGALIAPSPRTLARARRPKLIYREPRTLERATPPPQAGLVQAMDFSVDLPTGEAALESLLQQDRDLLDGVVPYDPPLAPPTTPSSNGTSFSLASCQYPAGFFDEPVAYRGYRTLAERIEANAGIVPRFSLFVGDQVYVDPTAGLYDPSATDDRYRLPYEAWLRQHDVRSALRRIPSFMLLDDHELDDNWEPVKSPPDDKDNAAIATAGVAGYNKYQRGKDPNSLTFDFDGFHFFMLKTRTERSHRKVGPELAKADLITPATMTALKQWLLDTPAPKFVLSPSMLLPRHRRAVQRDTGLAPSNLSALHSDSWDGYPNTLQEVLGFIAKEAIHGVVFLSGDEHRACVATIALTDGAGTPITRVHSIHTAAMYAPYPFANCLDEDLIASETIDIPNGNFKCNVTATQPPLGDGPTFIAVRPVGTDWMLDYEFADGVVRTLVL